MGHISKFARAATLVGCAMTIFAGLAYPAFAAASKAKAPAPPAAAPAQPPAAAPAQPDDAAQKPKDAASARAAYEAGTKSFQAGKLQPAVDQMSAALRGGGLTSPEMARALYIRGLAYKKQSKPGLAISDLTSALWLKNGLNDPDRASATAERAEAYKLAGLGDGNTGADTVAVADPNAAQPAAAPAPASKQTHAAAGAAPVAVVTNGEITRQAPDSEAAQDAARARKLAAAPVQDGGLQSVASAPMLSDAATAPAAVAEAVPAPIPTAVAAAMPAPAPTAVAVEGGAVSKPVPAAPTSTVSSFFSSLFGGSSSPAPATPVPVTTASTTASTTPAAATSSWTNQTAVAGTQGKPSAAAKGVQLAAVAPAAGPVSAPPVAAAKPAGKYKVHIAAVRSRADAEALAQKLMTQHAGDLKSHTAEVDEAVIGSMGTFYRVRVNGYANAEEPRSVCNTLRTSGFDCLVVTN